MAMADRIVVMNFGKVVEVGTPEQLYRAPQQRFTATFLGQTNCIDILAHGTTATLPWGQTVPMVRSFNGQGVASVRPEDLVLSPVEHGEGRISRMTYMGNSREFLVDIQGQELRVSSQSNEDSRLSIGDLVSISCRQSICPLEESPANQGNVKEVA